MRERRGGEKGSYLVLDGQGRELLLDLQRLQRTEVEDEYEDEGEDEGEGDGKEGGETSKQEGGQMWGAGRTHSTATPTDAHTANPPQT